MIYHVFILIILVFYYCQTSFFCCFLEKTIFLLALIVCSSSLMGYLIVFQAEELKKSLWSKNIPANVYVGMRYWHPFTEEAIEQVCINIDCIIVLKYTKNAWDQLRFRLGQGKCTRISLQPNDYCWAIFCLNVKKLFTLFHFLKVCYFF